MISVLMSAYNETERDLQESIESILNQTYKNFEFIIVIDNPNNQILESVIKEYSDSDNRIKYIVNDKNLGLALSLNRAADIAKGEFFLRMDADDIAYPNRMELELKMLQEKNLDLVCSGYDIIDENSSLLERNVGFCDDISLRETVPYQVAIHHPTVLMRRSAFEAAGRYRNFICAQDYDLWLRMWNQNCSFMIINTSLLQYRIRSQSTTSQKKYIQKCTLDYIKRLFWERLKTGYDTYSYDSYIKWLENKGAYNEKGSKDFVNATTTLSFANRQIKEGRVIKGYLYRAYVFLINKNYRESFLGHAKTHALITLHDRKQLRHDKHI